MINNNCQSPIQERLEDKVIQNAQSLAVFIVPTFAFINDQLWAR